EQQLEEEELLELQPPPRPAELAVVLRKMDGAEGDVAGDEVVPLAHPVRQHLGEGEAVLLEEAVDEPSERPAVEPDLVERGAAGVERDDAAGVERGALAVELVEVRVRHREGAAVLLGLAVERHAVLDREQPLDVVGAAEPDALQRAAALVLDAELEPAPPAAAGDHPLRLHPPDDRDGLAAGRELADRADGRAVEVAAGVGAGGVAEGLEARLPQRLRPARPDAGELLDVGVEDGWVGHVGGGKAGARRKTTVVSGYGMSPRPKRPRGVMRPDRVASSE